MLRRSRVICLGTGVTKNSHGRSNKQKADREKSEKSRARQPKKPNHPYPLKENPPGIYDLERNFFGLLGKSALKGDDAEWDKSRKRWFFY